MLKEWLVRRRDNPYPSREEKKALAIEAGLTYTQICNWFANWRRKLKGASAEENRKTWSNLIKNYNTSAHGNVEQFSICSSDSIWEENEDLNKCEDVGLVDKPKSEKAARRRHKKNLAQTNGTSNKFIGYVKEPKVKNSDHKKDPIDPPSSTIYENFYVPKTFSGILFPPGMGLVPIDGASPTNYSSETICDQQKNGYFATSKFKNHIMEKYLRGLEENLYNQGTNMIRTDCGYDGNNNQEFFVDGDVVETRPQLSKWLESAANFTPSKNSYIEWCARNRADQQQKDDEDQLCTTQQLSVHQREEIEAAEALTKLALNFRNRYTR